MFCFQPKRIAKLHRAKSSKSKAYFEEENSSFVVDLIDYAALQGILKKTVVMVIFRIVLAIFTNTLLHQNQ